jgi:hypothetical protein
MSHIAMNTNNPLGKRPYQQMGLAGDFDFPGAPVPWRRTAPEFLAGNAIKETAIHPPAIVQEEGSPWDALESTMMLGAVTTSTQTLVPTTDTTPVTTSAVASGQPVWSAWFAESSIIPGIKNWEVLVGGIALVALLKAFK